MTTKPPERRTMGATLIGEVLARRADSASAAWCASVRRAISPATEILAFGYTERHLADVRGETARSGIRRAAAICASSTSVPQGSGQLGQNLASLAAQAKTTRSRVDSAINMLPMLDLETAAGVFFGLVKLSAGQGVAINYFDLADTLGRWGEGLSPASQSIRRRVVADYYSAPDDEADAAHDDADAATDGDAI